MVFVLRTLNLVKLTFGFLIVTWFP